MQYTYFNNFRSLKCFSFSLVLLFVAVFNSSAFSEEGFVVVVNAENTYNSKEKSVLRKLRSLYLLSSSSWPNKSPSEPIGRGPAHPAQIIFQEKVLRMNDKRLEQHWERQKSRNKIPPAAIDHPRSLLQKIAMSKGAFGIMSKSELRKLPANVRILISYVPN